MAQQSYKIGLQNTKFPLLSEQQTRTAIGSSSREATGVDGPDQNQPGIQYMENVMPSARGLHSVGFREAIPAAPLEVGETVLDTRSIYGDKGTRIELTFDTNGRIYAQIINSGAWIAIPDPTPSVQSPTFTINDVTIGTVEMKSYIYFRQIGCYTYDEDTDTLEAVTLTGTSVANTTGVAASHGYLISYTRDAIAWSSTVDPTDFTPSEVTGAGGGEVADLSGLILFVIHSDLGIIIYSAANAVAGTYTGNPRYPFKFRPIKNSKGGVLLDKVAYEANAGRHYLYSQGGLQSVDHSGAEPILPEVTDFLSGKRIEDFDTVTRTFTVTDLDDVTNLIKKVKLIASRYLIISYGIGPAGNNFTYAFIYDIAMNKLGKIKFTHADVYELHRQGVEDTREQVAFMRDDGSVATLDLIIGRAGSGVLILGKLQYTRTRLLELQEVEIENIETGDTCSVSTNASFDGKNYTNVEGFLLESDDNVRRYGFRSEALNHSLCLIGDFHATTVLVKYGIGGRR